MNNRQCRHQTVAGNSGWYICQRQVGGGQGHAQHAVVGITSEHHHHLSGACSLGQILGVASKCMASVIDGSLLNRGSDDGIDLFRYRGIDRHIEHLQHREAIARVQLTWLGGCCQGSV